MADALRSGRSPLTRVKVQVLSSAPFFSSLSSHFDSLIILRRNLFVFFLSDFFDKNHIDFAVEVSVEDIEFI